MRQQCEFETTRLPVRAWHRERREAAEAKEPVDREQTDREVDLDRIVWDPEYRGEVLASMRPNA